MAIESANVNLEAMNAMRAGAQAMKSIHKNMSVDQVRFFGCCLHRTSLGSHGGGVAQHKQVDDTMADIQEQMDVANEISDAISQPVGSDMYGEFDDLEAELEALEQEDLDDKLGSLEANLAPMASPTAASTTTTSISSPAVPKSDPEDEEAQLRQLEAEMAIW